MSERTEKFTVRFTKGEARLLDDMRAALRPVPSRAEFVRSMVFGAERLMPTEEAREALPQ